MKSLVASDRVSLELGDCLEGLRALPSACIDAVITDPPYAEIDRPYGRLTEGDWHALMREVVHEVRRLLAMAAVRREDRVLRRHPSGQHMRKGRIAETVDARGGVTPFNVIPLSNGDSRTSGGARGHGAATPAPLCDWWIRYITKPAGVVLDPFAGSGTIGLRALALGRAYVGFEAHEEYAQEAARALREVGSAA